MTAKAQTIVSVSFFNWKNVILFNFFIGYKRFCNIALNYELLLKKRFPFYIL
jgi:hypothetical protein